MPSTAKQDNSEQQLRFIRDRLESGAPSSVRGLINSLHPAEIAHLLEALKPDDRKAVWNQVTPYQVGEILVELNDEVRTGLIEATEAKDLISAAETLESDDLVDLLKDLPDALEHQVLESMSKQDRSRFESALVYDDDSAGGLMSLDALTIRPDVTLDVVLRYLRLRGEMPDSTDNLIVVDREDHYQGVLPLTILLTHDVHKTVSDLMALDIEAIPADMEAADVALIFEQRDLVSAPVTSGEGKLLGRITIDDVVDVIRDEADHSIMSMAGLDEEQDMFAPVLLSARRRSLWLGVNLFTAFMASWVIGLYEATLDQIVALAILMPIVASMGGVAGSQTLTLVIRGLALRQIGETNALSLLFKELSIGLINGLVWAAVVAVVAGIWFDSSPLGVLIGGALIINLFCAALAGAVIPFILHRAGIDPALAGGVLLTTVTDVVGFMAFLGLATYYLL